MGCTDEAEHQNSTTTEARGEILHFTERDRFCRAVGEEGDTAASDGSRHATAECWINSL